MDERKQLPGKLKFGEVIAAQVLSTVVDTRIFVPDNVHPGGGGGALV
jgi:hypothetical protein